MSSGFCPALLADIADVAEQNAPNNKLPLTGFLKMLFCCQNSSVNPINAGNDNNEGTNRPLTVKYRQRPTVDQVSSVDSCDVNQIPGYNEWTLPGYGFKSFTQFLPDDLVRQYCNDSVQTRAFGKPATSVMQEVYTIIKESAVVVLQAMNRDLVTQMGTKFGYNTTTNHPTGKIINVERDGTQFVLDNGVIEMLRDIQENEICGEPCYVGGGMFLAWDQAKKLACCNSAGVDASKLTQDRTFFDKDTQAIWGPDSFGVFAPGSVKLLSQNLNVGSFGGEKGASIFASFVLPVEDFAACSDTNCLSDLVFDLQLKYNDCAATININGVATGVKRGWIIIVSKRYALWVQPISAYKTGDPLANTNGTLKYYMTNNASNTAPYAAPYGAPYNVQN